MSQNDWQYFISESRPFLGTTGSAGQHSLLSNPITSSGDWYRAFYSAANENSSFSMLPINNSDLTSSSGYEYGYAYSIRCWYRVANKSDSNGVCLVFKGNSSLTSNQWGGNRPESGYVLHAANEKLTLRCSVDSSTGNSILDPSDPNYNYQSFYIDNINSSPLTTNLWHRLRMDVTPVSGAFDKITIYTGSQNDTWFQQYTVNIPRTKTRAYIPWANNPNGDGANAAGYGYLGIKGWTWNTAYPILIDQFEVYKEKVT